MPNIFGKLKLLTLKSKDKEFEDATGDYIDCATVAYDRAKLLFQIKEIKKQNEINRNLVFATWVMAIATWVLVGITLISKE